MPSPFPLPTKKPSPFSSYTSAPPLSPGLSITPFIMFPSNTARMPLSTLPLFFY